MSDLAQPEPAAVTPAGWYPDPDMAGTQRYWTGSSWTEHRAPLAPAAPVALVGRQAYRTNHVFHLIMTFLTVGLWAPFVWLPVAMYNSSQAAKSDYRAQHPEA